MILNVHKTLLRLAIFFILLTCSNDSPVSTLTHKINFADDTPLIGHRQNYSKTKYCKIESYTLQQDSVGFSGQLQKTELVRFKDGKIDEQLVFDSTGLLEEKQKYLYNRNENLIEIIKYDEQESPGEKVLFVTDDLGNIFEEQRLIDDSSYIVEKWVYSYMPENNKIEITNVNSFMHTVVPLKRVYIFDDNYNVTESSVINLRDTVLFSQKFKYSEDSLLIHKEEMDENAKIKSVSDYMYDESNRILEITCFNFDFNDYQDSTLSKTFYSYVDF